MTCSKCGNKSEYYFRICPSCSYDVLEATFRDPQKAISGRPAGSSDASPVSSQKMSQLMQWAIGVIAVSIIAIIGSHAYTSNHRLAGFRSFIGYNDSAYIAAGWATTLGTIGLLVGIGLLIGAFVRK